MTTAKNEVFIGLKHENCYVVEELTFDWQNKYLVGESAEETFF